MREKNIENAEYSDAELIRRYCQENDTLAFDKLMVRYQDMVFRLCYRLLGNYDDALEVAQEVFLSCYRKLRTFTGKAKFSTWLYRLTVNHCKNFWRRQRRSIATHTISLDQTNENKERPPLQIANGNPDPREEIASRQLQQLVQERVRLLSPEYHQVLILRYSEELSYEEIAEIVGCPVGTVKSRLNRARKELHTLLKDIWDVK